MMRWMSAFYQRLFDVLKSYRSKTIADIFADGGRDIYSSYNVCEGNGRFIALDYGENRITDMLDNALSEGKIAAIRHAFPDKLPFRIKVDFLICNAGIIFLPSDQLVPTFDAIGDMMADNAQMILRFSGEHEDVREKVGKSYFIHQPEAVQQLLNEKGFVVEFYPDLPDPAGRPYMWHDFTVKKC